MLLLASMVYIERAVLDPMGLRWFANTPTPTPTTEEPSTAPAALTEQAVLALTVLRSCADRIRSMGASDPQLYLETLRPEGNGSWGVPFHMA